jgi:hypothetical protein
MMEFVNAMMVVGQALYLINLNDNSLWKFQADFNIFDCSANKKPDLTWMITQLI